MSIRPINGKGVNRATAICDSCGREHTVTCDYERRGPGRPGIPNEGQIIRKLTAHGWVVVSGRLFCPGCEACRKAAAAPIKPEWKETAIMAQKETASAAPREPTKAMRIDILVAISSCYDLEAQRYKGDATDRTIAEVVAGGCMPGWVTAVREAEFGPAGNEEVDAIRAELAHAELRIAEVRKGLDAMMSDVIRARDNFEKQIRADLATLKTRINACVASHDKRVRA